MKNFYRHITCIGLSVGLFLASCSDNGTVHPVAGADGEWVPLLIAGATIGSGIDTQTRADAGAQTRADDPKTVTEGTIGIYLKKDANYPEALDNKKYTHATGDNHWQTDEPLLLGAKDATLVAYYPYVASGASPILLHSRLYDADNELYYQIFRAHNTTAALTLNLQRVYSCIGLSFNTPADDSGYKGGDGKIENVRIEGAGILSSATLDILADNLATAGVYGTRTPLPHAEGVEATLTATSLVAGNPADVDLLMIPTTLTGDLTLYVTIDGRELSVTLAATALCGTGGILREGVKYLLNLTVKSRELTVSSIDKTEWEITNVSGDYVIE